MDAILPVLLFVAIAAVVSVSLVILPLVVAPRRRGAVKEMPYESGMDPIHDTRRRFDVRFHLVAITFLVFDVELLFLYPWAVIYKDMIRENAGLILGGILPFVMLIFVGFVYELKKGGLDWKQ